MSDQPSSTWDPSQYERFEKERSQPFYDLLALVQRTDGMRVVDLGCGTGKLTQVLHRDLGAVETIGIDSSETMLKKSESLSGAGLRFERADIREIHTERPFNLVFSNAALHWVPDHPELLRRLTGNLAAGGQLAVQVPANQDHPTHVVASEVAAEEPFRGLLGDEVNPPSIQPPAAYAELLDRLGYRSQHVRLQVYGHHLPSRDDVVEWVKGSLLTVYQKHLPADLFAQFLERYRQRLLPQLDDTRPYFYPFKRVLFWGRL